MRHCGNFASGQQRRVSRVLDLCWHCGVGERFGTRLRVKGTAAQPVLYDVGQT
jgi:hypothetical protein